METIRWILRSFGDQIETVRSNQIFHLELFNGSPNLRRSDIVVLFILWIDRHLRKKFVAFKKVQ